MTSQSVNLFDKGFDRGWEKELITWYTFSVALKHLRASTSFERYFSRSDSCYFDLFLDGSYKSYLLGCFRRYPAIVLSVETCNFCWKDQ